MLLVMQSSSASGATGRARRWHEEEGWSGKRAPLNQSLGAVPIAIWRHLPSSRLHFCPFSPRWPLVTWTKANEVNSQEERVRKLQQMDWHWCQWTRWHLHLCIGPLFFSHKGRGNNYSTLK